MNDHEKSPCVSICALDEDDVCMGCSRTGEEIMGWGKMTNDQRREVLKKVAEREQAKYVDLGRSTN